MSARSNVAGLRKEKTVETHKKQVKLKGRSTKCYALYNGLTPEEIAIVEGKG